MGQLSRTIEGCLAGVSGKTEVSGVEVWFAYRTVDGDETTVRVRTDKSGNFTVDLPEDPLVSARVGASLEGVAPVDLEPGGRRLEPGELTLLVDDIVPSYLRFGGV